MTKEKIEIISTSSPFFHTVTYGAAAQTHSSYTEPALDYIASLLNQVTKSSPKEEGSFLSLSQMARLWVESLQKPRQDQLTVSKHIGDVSLLVSGLFSDATNQKLLNLEYFVHMGKTGYHHASHVSRHKETAQLFLELSQKFLTYLEILHRVSQTLGLIDTQNILNLYEKWLQTHNPHVKALLATHGIICGEPPATDT